MPYSARDFRHDTPPRIIGSETEFTSAVHTRSLRDDDYESSMPRGTLLVSEKYTTTGTWLRNGGRFYVDDDVLEYSTPECLTPTELLASERAGEIIMQHVVDTLPLELAYRNVYKRTGYGEIKVSRNDTHEIDSNWTVGNHENYFSYLTTKAVILNSYLATRPIWSGAGMVDQDGYELSQQARTIRHKNFASPGSDNRLEVRSGEGNMSDWAIVTKYGMTSLVIRMIEHDVFPVALHLEAPTQALALASMNPFKKCIPTLGRGNMSAVEHQHAIAIAARTFADYQPNIPAAEIAAADDVIRVCEQLIEYRNDKGGLELIDDRVDWAAKLSYMISMGLKEKDITTSNSYVPIMYDLQWEDIARNGISRLWYAKRGNTHAGKKMIMDAMKVPPSTRARYRIKKIKRFSNPNRVIYVDWDEIGIDGGMSILMYNPYKT